MEYKLKVLTYKSLNTEQPPYLASLLHCHVPARQTVRTKLATQASRHTAPTIWNTLSEHLWEKIAINGFKFELKTYLYSLAYDH